MKEISIAKLEIGHLEKIQALFEKCKDYAWIVDGEKPSPEAAREVLESLPPGKSIADKFLCGVMDEAGELSALLEGVRGYPDEKTWWIGLLLLSPEARGKGLGRELFERLAGKARDASAAAIMLGVVEDNENALRFWQRIGFEEVRWTAPQQFGKKRQRVIVMRRLLFSQGS
jgi:GNAT superfamily N-acetyltransferase